MPCLLVQHGRSYKFLDYKLQDFSDVLAKAISAYIDSLTSYDTQKFSIRAKLSILQREYFLGTLGIWRLQARPVLDTDYDLSEGWIRHTYDVIPVSSCVPEAGRQSKTWTSLIWHLKKTPNVVAPSRLFEGARFLLCVPHSVNDPQFAFLTHLDWSEQLPEALEAFGSAVGLSDSTDWTHCVASGQPLSTWNSNPSLRGETDESSVAIDVHWIYACIALGRQLPVEPYLLASPFTSSSTDFLPYPGKPNAAQLVHRRDAWENAGTKVHVGLILNQKFSGPFGTLPLAGVALKVYPTCLWMEPLFSSIVDLFKRLGGREVSEARHANYLAGALSDLQGIIAINSGAINTDFFHLLHSVASASMIPVDDSLIFHPLSIRNQEIWSSILFDVELIIITDYYTDADLFYLRSLCSVMGALTSLASEDSPPSIPSAADPDIIISPYELPVPWPQFGSDVPIVDHHWLENCYACRDEVNHAPFVSFGRPSLPKKRQRTDRIKRVQKASSLTTRYAAVTKIVDSQSDW